MNKGLHKFLETLYRSAKVNSKILYECLIHKVDGFGEEKRMEISRMLQTKISEDLNENNMGRVTVRFHLTSIYDHSIFIAFSKMTQRLISSQLQTLESLLDILVIVNLSFSLRLSIYIPEKKPPQYIIYHFV